MTWEQSILTGKDLWVLEGFLSHVTLAKIERDITDYRLGRIDPKSYETLMHT